MTRIHRFALRTVLCAIGVYAGAATAVAESKIATVTLHAVKVAERKVEVRFDDSELVIPFELPRNARVQIDRKKVALSELKKGQTATLMYDSEKKTIQLLRVVTEDGPAPRGVFRSGRPKGDEDEKSEEKPGEEAPADKASEKNAKEKAEAEKESKVEKKENKAQSKEKKAENKQEPAPQGRRRPRRSS